MGIEFACPHCGELLKLRDEAAGKRGRCPKCGGQVTVPGVSTGGPEDTPAGKPATPPRPTSPPPVTAGLGKSASAVCPGCKNDLPPSAVICVKCGLNLKTGRKIKTVFEPPEEAADEEPEAGPTEPQPPAP